VSQGRATSRLPAIFAVMIGAVGIVSVALMVQLGNGEDTGPSPRAEPTDGGVRAVDVTIWDRLSSTQYSESVYIEIDGNTEGDLVIDRQRPEDSMTVSLAPGNHVYEIQGNTQAKARDGSWQEFPVEGKGEITVSDEDNQSFGVVKTVTSGSTLVAYLE
jgi:hypothetical protein